MKKDYLQPQASLIYLNINDIIAVSGEIITDEGTVNDQSWTSNVSSGL